MPTTLRLLQVGGAKLTAEDSAAVREALTPGVQQVFRNGRGPAELHRPGDPIDIVDHTQGRPPGARMTNCGWWTTPGPDVAPGAEGELLVRGAHTPAASMPTPSTNAPSPRTASTAAATRSVAGPTATLEVTGRVKDAFIHRGWRDGFGTRSRGAPAEPSGCLVGGRHPAARRVPRRKKSVRRFVSATNRSHWLS